MARQRRVETGFKSLRDLIVCCVGIWSFWFQVTRVAKPDRFILAASILLMVTPSATAVYRIVNAVLSSNARVLRETEREDQP